MKIMMTSLTTTTTRLWSQALKVFKNLKLSKCASSQTISSWIFVPKNLGNSSTQFTSVLPQKILLQVIGISQMPI
jgi:hypothetical protein